MMGRGGVLAVPYEGIAGRSSVFFGSVWARSEASERQSVNVREATNALSAARTTIR